MNWSNSTPMNYIEENNSATRQVSAIPAWLKLFMLATTLGDLLVVVRGFSASATELFGIPVSIILGIALPFFFLLVSITAGFLFSPTSRFSQSFYWMLRFAREQIIVLSLFGGLYLLVLQTPFNSFRSGLAWLTLLVLFVVGLLLKPTTIQEKPFNIWRKKTFIQEARGVFQRMPVWIPQVVISFIPVGLALFIIVFVLGSGLSHYGPYSHNNDEVAYWVWLRSFHEVGFQSGYNVPNELLPVFEFSRYGEQSPIYLYLYGALTKWIGWFPALPVLVNFLLLTVSIFLLLRSFKLTAGQTILAICAIVLTWPVLWNLPATTHETLNQALGILLAIMLAKLLIDREELSLVSRVGIVLFAYFVTLVRVSWGFVLIPIVFYCLNGKLVWKIILAVLVGGGLFLSAVVLTGYFTPPINDTVSMVLQQATVRGPVVFLETLYAQFYLMFLPRQLSPNLGTLFQMAVVVGWGIISLVNSIRSKKIDLHAALHSVETFNIYHMLALGLAGLIFYAHKNFHRTFAPALLIFYLLQVKRKDYKPVVALLLVSIFLFPSVTYAFVKDDYTRGIPPSPEIQRQMDELVVYNPEASNPWCNTLLIPLEFYDSRLMSVPPGIGIAYIMLGPFETPFKSRYVLFDEATYQVYKDTTHLQLLTSLPIGNLYQNQDIECTGNR